VYTDGRSSCSRCQACQVISVLDEANAIEPPESYRKRKPEPRQGSLDFFPRELDRILVGRVREVVQQRPCIREG